MLPTLSNAAVGYLVGTSIAVIGLYLAFVFPIFLRWRLGDEFEAGQLDARQALQVDRPARDRLGRAHLHPLPDADRAGGHPGQRTSSTGTSSTTHR